jgi:protein-S-isoprenylcysteine O-methyltransferase Ste14
MTSGFAKKVFKYRSYTPIPFLLLMFFYENANVWSLITGFLITVAGEMIRLWGVSYAGSETRTTGDVGGSRLIISGPFAYVRNPLYVGNILMYTGIGIMSFALFPYLQIAGLIFFSLQYYVIVKEEETYLYSTFGSDYKEYTKNVNRFLPGFTPYRKPSAAQPEYNLKKGLRSERRSLQAFGFVTLTIVLLWFIGRM